MEASTDSYQEVSLDESIHIVDGVVHAAHVMLYARVDKILFGRHDIKYAILMQVRFDGTLEFPGGIVDKGETPEDAVNREMCEELGCSRDSCVILRTDHVISHVSCKTQFCLHFYSKQISVATLEQMERSAIVCSHYGSEVMGVVRCPLHTLPSGRGFPDFLHHQFTGISKTQLLCGVERRGLLTAAEIQAALKASVAHGESVYKDMTREEALKMPDHVIHASHVVLYTPLAGKLFGKYDLKGTVMIQMRFDGTLGFPGGMVNKGETPEMAVNREMYEELGCSVDKFAVTSHDHLFSKISSNPHRNKTWCFHCYAKEISMETLQQVEKSSLFGNDYGLEVLGVMRCPLYTLPNGLGFPAFLNHRFIADSRGELLHVIRERKLLSDAEIRAAVENSEKNQDSGYSTRH